MRQKRIKPDTMWDHLCLSTSSLAESVNRGPSSTDLAIGINAGKKTGYIPLLMAIH